jgi:hypothetical protein
MPIQPLNSELQAFFNRLCCVEPPEGIPPTVNYTNTSFSFTEGTAVNECPNTLIGDPTITLSISPSLPAGLTFNTSTGCITGTPTEPRLVESYTVTATNAFGTATDNFNLVVVALGEITITGAGWDTPANAKAYITNGSTTATNVSYDSKNDILYWTEPANTQYLSSNFVQAGGSIITAQAFMEGKNATNNLVGMPNATTSELAVFNDPNQRIIKINGFNGNTKNHNFNYLTEVAGFDFSSGNYIFGNNVIAEGLASSTGNITFGNGCEFNDVGNSASGNVTIGNNSIFKGAGAFLTFTGTAVVGTGSILDFNSFGTEGLFGNSVGATVTIGNGITTTPTGVELLQNIIGGTSVNTTFNVGDITNVRLLFGGSQNAIVNFTGNIWTTEGQDLVSSPLINPNATNITINALVAKETSNGGGIEGDLANLINNGFTVNFIL